jgi:hypothetical protein
MEAMIKAVTMAENQGFWNPKIDRLKLSLGKTDWGTGTDLNKKRRRSRGEILTYAANSQGELDEIETEARAAWAKPVWKVWSKEKETMAHELGHDLSRRSTKRWMNGKMFLTPEESWAEAGVRPPSVKVMIKNGFAPEGTTADRIYALHSPQEFIADVFSGLLHGHKFEPRIMKLYYLLDGPKPDRGKLYVEG